MYFDFPLSGSVRRSLLNQAASEETCHKAEEAVRTYGDYIPNAVPNTRYVVIKQPVGGYPSCYEMI